MKRIITAAIHCKGTAYIKLNERAIKVKNNMITNAGVFPDAAADLALLKTEQELFGTLIADAKGNSLVKKQRNTLAKKILLRLKILVMHVNLVAEGDPTIIILSGFDCSADPIRHPIPVKVVIRRVVNGASNRTAKIYIEAMGQTGLTFNVRVTTIANAVVDDLNWKTVLQTTNSKELVIPDLIRGKEVFITINASNASGTGLWSEAAPFILQ